MQYKEMIWTDEMVSRFWDWQSQYPETYFTNLFGKEIITNIKPFINKTGSVLDFGCGVGFLASHLSCHYDNVYATDISPQSIKKTNERNNQLSGFKGATLLSELMDKKETFDAITCVEVIEHLYDDNLEKVCSSIRSLLKPEGLVIFTTPNDEDRSANMIICPTSNELFHRWQHVRSWNAEQLSAYLNANGFEVVDTLETDLTDMFQLSPKYLIKKMVRILLKANQAKKPHLICVARKK